MTKFRLSNHSLMIEIGRHKEIPKERRFCPFCPNSVETEIHFLLLCPVYDLLRREVMGSINGLWTNGWWGSSTTSLFCNGKNGMENIPVWVKPFRYVTTISLRFF